MVCRQVTRGDGKIMEAPLKTKNTYRTVSISLQAAEVLNTQKEASRIMGNVLILFPIKSRRFLLENRLLKCNSSAQNAQMRVSRRLRRAEAL